METFAKNTRRKLNVILYRISYSNLEMASHGFSLLVHYFKLTGVVFFVDLTEFWSKQNFLCLFTAPSGHY